MPRFAYPRIFLPIRFTSPTFLPIDFASRLIVIIDWGSIVCVLCNGWWVVVHMRNYFPLIFQNDVGCGGTGWLKKTSEDFLLLSQWNWLRWRLRLRGFSTTQVCLGGGWYGANIVWLSYYTHFIYGSIFLFGFYGLWILFQNIMFLKSH